MSDSSFILNFQSLKIESTYVKAYKTKTQTWLDLQKNKAYSIKIRAIHFRKDIIKN